MDLGEFHATNLLLLATNFPSGTYSRSYLRSDLSLGELRAAGRAREVGGRHHGGQKLSDCFRGGVEDIHRRRLRLLWLACIAQGMAARGAAMKAETSQFRAAVWKKRKRDEKGSGSGEDDEGGGEMIVHVPKAVEKRIKACVLMGPELGNMTVTKALAVEGLQRGLEEAHIGSSSMFILTNRFIPGLVGMTFESFVRMRLTNSSE